MGIFKFLKDNLDELAELTAKKPVDDANKTAADTNDELPDDVMKSFADTPADKVKDWLIEFSSIAVPLILLVSLIASNGYFFSGFKTFSLADFNTVIQWSVGAAIELGTASLLYLSSRAKKKGNKRWFNSLLGASVLLLISVIGQYMYLKVELHLDSNAMGTIPIFGALVGVGGMSNADVFYFLRSVGMHIAELFTIFLLVPRGMSVEKLLELQRKRYEYNSQNSLQSMSLKFMSTIQSTVTTMMSVEQAKMEQQGKVLIEGANKKEAVPYNRPIPNVVPVALVNNSKAEPLDFPMARLTNPANQSSNPSTQPLIPSENAVGAETSSK